MAESIVSGVVLKLLDYISQSASATIAPYFGGRRKLRELTNTMRIIQARLLDAERRNEGGNEALIKEWLNRLKDVVYRLEDLFDEVSLADMELEQMPKGKLTRQLCILCSCSRNIDLNRNVIQEGNAIMKELIAIRSDIVGLNLKVLSYDEQRKTEMARRESHSFILEEEVIGREDDKDVIAQLLINSDHTVLPSVCVIPIVGIGGLGKTTLAQLAYNEEKVQQYFELKGWACLSGISTEEEIVRKILTAILDDDFQDLNIEQLQQYLRQTVSDNRYLLVLDDVWDEDRERWLCLRRLLSGGKAGSKIIVTTRSGIVAQNMGTIPQYELKGLSVDKSWELFQSLAFKEGAQKGRDPRLMGIGREIVKKCANVPLVIRTVAGILYIKNTEQEWEYFKDSELRMMEENDNSIMSTLKLSYDHLPSHLKRCFAYCAMFPKDYEIDKPLIIYLWIAQGFIQSSKGNETLEDIGHAYFMELLRRSFFQDAKRNEYDDIICFKMHDLMSELARTMARDDCHLVESTQQPITDRIRHLSLVAGSINGGMLSSAKGIPIRTLLFLSDSVVANIDMICSKMRCLRALDFANANCKSLPTSIGQLKHLRYLRLGSYLESLPECITKLQNLRTLDIRRCYKLRELPKGIVTLIKLQNFHFGERLNDLPPGFGLLTSLHSLDFFIVGKNNGLDALAELDNLAGELKIRHNFDRKDAVSEARAVNLQAKKLTNLFLTWPSSHQANVSYTDEKEEEVLKSLQPPPSIRRLKVLGWKGVRFPKWGMSEFPYLISISIRSCHRCKHLPNFSQMPHLRFLRLWDLDALEYIEDDSDHLSSPVAVATYFPSLESLLLLNLPALKGWSKFGLGKSQQKTSFPSLTELAIQGCPKMMSMPVARRLETLDANEIHAKLLRDLLSLEQSAESLKWLHLHSIEELISLSIDEFSGQSLTISECQELTQLTAERPTSKLFQLVIDECCRLTDISNALQHLSSLQELEILRCEELDRGDYDDKCIIRSKAWQGVKKLRSLTLSDLSRIEFLPKVIGNVTTLQKLRIVGLTNLRILPEWIQQLKQLHVLEIRNCPELMALPQSLTNLTSLQELHISQCPQLQIKYQCSGTTDWSLIHHIPNICME